MSKWWFWATVVGVAGVATGGVLYGPASSELNSEFRGFNLSFVLSSGQVSAVP